MASEGRQDHGHRPLASGAGAIRPMADRPSPDWADGLKRLYDAVVEEELPDSFKDLLARLDDPGAPGGGGPAR